MAKQLYVVLCCWCTFSRAMETAALLKKKCEGRESLLYTLMKELGSDDSQDPVTPLQRAVDMLQPKKVAHLLQQGAFISKRDAKGRTVFHRICHLEKAGKTLRALLISPRKAVIDTVKKMGIEEDNFIAYVMRWHLLGIVRVLMMQDNEGHIARECAYEEWDMCLIPDYSHLLSWFGMDIISGYNRYLHKQEVKALYE